jgi:hypothetical protein
MITEDNIFNRRKRMKTGVFVGETEVEIFISHVKYDDEYHPMFQVKKKGKTIIANTISTVKIGNIEFKEAASCSGGDKFIRRKGTSLSLGRALKSANLDKTTRTKIWSKIWNGKYDKQENENV